MPAAARVGDQTAHQAPLTGVGSPTVLIGGRGAWLVGFSNHFCPAVTDNSGTHGPGFMFGGSTSVFVEGYPMARKGDTVIERQYTDDIISGDETVLIG